MRASGEAGNQRQCCGRARSSPRPWLSRLRPGTASRRPTPPAFYGRSKIPTGFSSAAHRSTPRRRRLTPCAARPARPLPPNILWKVERRLNDPDCKDASTPSSCLATARGGYEKSRLGWAAQTLDVNCYDRNARPRRYMVTCDRQYSWGLAKEDYILPDAHTVVMHIAPEDIAAGGPGDCLWTWQPRRGGAPAETKSRHAPPSS